MTLATEEQLLSLAHHTARARKYSLNRNAQRAVVSKAKAALLFTHRVIHTWLVASSKLFMVASVTKAAHFFKLSLCVTFPTTSLLNLGPQGEPCLMGVKRIYRKLKPTSRCVMGKTYSVSMTSGPCDCTEADFEWWLYFSIVLTFNSSDCLCC